MKDATLWELTEEQKRLQMWMEEEGSENDQSLRDTLEMVEQDFEEKADGYGKIVKNLDAHEALIDAAIEQHKEAIKGLTAYKNTIESNKNDMEFRLLNALIATGKTNKKGNPEYRTEHFRFGSRSSSSVVIDARSVYDIPDDYLRYKDPEPDKTAIKEFLKDNECEWAHVETKTSLSLR